MRPSTDTVHAPHSPTPQHSFGPYRRKVSRRRSNKEVLGPDIQRVAPAVDDNFDWVRVTHVFPFQRQVFRQLGVGLALPTP